MDYDNESNNQLLSKLEIEATSETTAPNIPEKSRKSYEQSYNHFMEWRSKKQINSFSEQVLMDYFVHLSSKFKCTTMWTYFSMLRSTLHIHHNIKLEQYHKLRLFLKRTGENYQPKKSKTLTPEEINKFITEAPDEIYLVTKVSLIMGIMGSCRKSELYAMRIEDVQDLNTAFFVTVPNPNSKVTRRFTITDNFYSICKKYIDLRVPNANFFFLNYQNGKCTIQRMGLNKFGRMGKDVARYLKLPNPGLYTGHCFRRSSANLLVDKGGDITDLKRLGGWKKPSELTERYIDEAINKLQNIAQNSVQQANPTAPCTSSTNQSVPDARNGCNPVPNFGLQEQSNLVSHDEQVSTSTTPIDHFDEIHVKQSISDEETSFLDNEDNSMPVKPMYVDVKQRNNANVADKLCPEIIDVNNQKEIISHQLKIMDEESKKKIDLMRKESEVKIECLEREHEANMDCIRLKKEILHKEIELLNIKINKEKS